MARGWSQEHMATHVRVHRTYMGAIERGEKSITVDMALRIAAALAIPVHQLMKELESRLALSGDRSMRQTHPSEEATSKGV